MILTERMRKVELHVLHRDIDTVLEYLGNSGCLQIDLSSVSAAETHSQEERADTEETQYQARQAEIARALNELRQFLSSSATPPASGPVTVAGAEDVTEAELLISRGSELMRHSNELVQRRNAVVSTLDEVSAFARLQVPFKDIENLTFLTLRFGILPEEKHEELEKKLGNRAILLPLDGAGRVLAAASKKGRFALDSELKNCGFQETGIPSDVEGVPKEVVIALGKDLRQIEKLLSEVEAERDAFARAHGARLSDLARRFSVATQINEVKRGLATSKTVYRLSGWVPQGLMRETIRNLEELTSNRSAIRVYTPGELPSVRNGNEKVPVRLKHSGLVRSFERMVFSYGAPLYGTIDPTPLVAFLFILLFAIMFGDVGQGFIGVAAGVVFIRGKRILGEERWNRWRHFGPIFIAVGVASMITGFLYGSVFSEEKMLIPVTRAITGALFGAPRDRFISLMPEGGLDRIFIFFGFTLSLGIVINSLGLLINIYNQIRLRRYFHAFLTKTGLAGATFFWYSISIGIRVGLGGKFGPIDAIMLFIPISLLFWAEPIHRLTTHKPTVFPDGVLSFVVSGLVEILESVSYYLSNSLSFLRVAAFALSHTVLSLIVFKIVELLHGMAGDFFFQTIVIIIGNLLIIFLEGLIVSIQVIRLQYYEFFSKFFTETGVEFHPFALRSDV